MRVNSKGGFTLVEVIVVVAIIAILAGILVPIIFQQIDEARKTRAIGDIKSISTAMFVFKKDTAYWPMRSRTGNDDVTLVRGEGDLPGGDLGALGFDTSSVTFFDDYLLRNTYGYSPWQGPYLPSVIKDPWGKCYLSNVKDFNTDSPVWIISAGPNGTMETPIDPGQVSTAGDDIGLRIK